MSDMNRSFAGQMPEFYDRFLVPMMFAPFAQDLARRLHGMASGNVLELAAGTGILTRALVRTLPRAVAITATDLNRAMLDQAKSHPGLERVQWQEADALSLPFADQQFDFAVCQFGVMFFSDKVAAFREALRVLRPGGRFLFSVWSNREGSVWDVAVTVVGRFLSREPASLVASVYNDVATVQADLNAAGFEAIAAEDVIQFTHASSAREAAISQCHGGLIRAAIDAQMPDRVDEITDAASAAIAAQFGSGPIESPLHAILFRAARPITDGASVQTRANRVPTPTRLECHDRAPRTTGPMPCRIAGFRHRPRFTSAAARPIQTNAGRSLGGATAPHNKWAWRRHAPRANFFYLSSPGCIDAKVPVDLVSKLSQAGIASMTRVGQRVHDFRLNVRGAFAQQDHAACQK